MLKLILVRNRLDNLIIDAITNMKESRGSDRAAIAMYIEVSVLMSLHLFQEPDYYQNIRMPHLAWLSS